MMHMRIKTYASRGGIKACRRTLRNLQNVSSMSKFSARWIDVSSLPSGVPRTMSYPALHLIPRVVATD